MAWQCHQLDHVQIICTSFQTNNHASNFHASTITQFLQAECSSWCPTNSVKALNVSTIWYDKKCIINKSSASAETADHGLCLEISSQDLYLKIQAKTKTFRNSTPVLLRLWLKSQNWKMPTKCLLVRLTQNVIIISTEKDTIWISYNGKIITV